MRSGRRAIAVVGALVLLVACSSDKGTGQGPTGRVRARGERASFLLRAADQQGDGRTVRVAEAVFAGARGFVAIHADGGGVPGETLGVSPLLPQGSSRNVTVRLAKPLRASGYVFPMLHVDDDGNGRYDFPRADAPPQVTGNLVVLRIRVEVTRA